jgi:hypothetical protein
MNEPVLRAVMPVAMLGGGFPVHTVRRRIALSAPGGAPVSMNRRRRAERPGARRAGRGAPLAGGPGASTAAVFLSARSKRGAKAVSRSRPLASDISVPVRAQSVGAVRRAIDTL